MSAPPTEGSKREFFPQLTSVRFFAAFVVVLYHYHKELTPYLPSVLNNFVTHGYVGVSFFFLLSGFILAANYYDRMLDKRVSKADFWWARFSRIYPVYLLSIIIFLPRFFLPPGTDPIPEQAAYAHAHIPEVFVVTVFLLQSFGSPAGGFLNSPTWSISTEAFFYVLLPFLLPLIAKLKPKHLVPGIVILFLLAGVGPYLYHGYVFSEGLSKMGVNYTRDLDVFLNQFVRMSFITRLPEFLIGVLAYRLYREVLREQDYKWVYLVGAIASLPFLWAVFFEPDEQVINTVLYSGQFTSIPFFLTVILGLVGTKARALDFLKSPSWILLGEASFALYLFHIPIKNFGQFVVGRVLHIPKDNVAIACLLIAFSVAISIPIFSRFETPIRKKLTVWYKDRQSHAKA